MAAQQDPPFPRVLLANISRGSVNTKMVTGVMDSLAHGRAVNSMFYESGPYLDAGRNGCIANALRVTTSGLVDLPHAEPLAWDWLLFVDSDIEFNHTHVETLLSPTAHPLYNSAKYPVLSGVYINPFNDGLFDGDIQEQQGGCFGPVAYEWTERLDLAGNLNGLPTMAFRRLSRSALATRAPVNMPWNPPGENGTPSPVTEVGACGAGFLAIHVSLIDRMTHTYPEPMVYFDEPIINGCHYGEDFGFCYRVREMGYPVLVNRACTVLHHKTTILI